jgi:hypothetical protein
MVPKYRIQGLTTASDGPADRGIELVACTSVAVALVLLRSIIFTLYENIFDSDQAIVGLMAKHLSELRAFPLFFYGQHYMLGVQAWIAAPFFLIGGPTVAMLRLPLVFINVTVVVALLFAFIRRGVRPLFSLAAILPLAATCPAASRELLSALGASIEPFFYVLALWKLRNRPSWFGALLCFGTLHREFTIFALPATLVVQWLEYREIRWRPIAKAAATFAAVWILIDLIKVHVNTLGALGSPAGDHAESLVQEAREVGMLLNFNPASYLASFSDLLTKGLPNLFGARSFPLGGFGIQSMTGERAWLVAGTLAGAAVLCSARLLWSARKFVARPHDRNLRFCLYLALVAGQTIFAYGLKGIHGNVEPELAYVLFALLLPVAVLGAYFQVESRQALRWAVAALLVVGASVNVTDNVRLVREFRTAPPANGHRDLATYLTSHRIKYGYAIYWDAYFVDFLSRERVVLASLDTVRIEKYQTLVDLNRSNAATIHRQPCSDGTPVADWCVNDPFKR